MKVRVIQTLTRTIVVDVVSQVEDGAKREALELAAGIQPADWDYGSYEPAAQEAIVIPHLPQPYLTTSGEVVSRFVFMGLRFKVIAHPDEDGAHPDDTDSEFELTPYKVTAWHRNEWAYFFIRVIAIDDNDEPLEIDGQDFERSYGRLPSCIDHTDLILSLCTDTYLEICELTKDKLLVI